MEAMRRKCPKCHGSNFDLTEHSDAAQTWFVRAGEYTPEEGYMEPGDVNYMTADCKDYGHGWKLRSAKQITDISDHGGNQTSQTGTTQQSNTDDLTD